MEVLVYYYFHSLEKPYGANCGRGYTPRTKWVYQIEGEIARGGMGAIYLAKRQAD